MPLSTNNGSRNLIAAIDFGSTHAFARIYNEKCESIAESIMSSKTTDPEVCWFVTCNLLETVLKRAGVRPRDLNCLGISVQRNTFLLWHRETSRPVTRLCTWQENNASSYASDRNESYFVRALNKTGKLLYKVAPTPKFKMASHYQLTCIFSVTRLAHMFEEDPSLYEKCRKGELVYGCLETWLLWRLTGGRAWCTDASCTSATGAFDPSIVGLSPVVLNFLKISSKIFPAICPTCTFYGEVRCGPLADIRSDSGETSGRKVRVTALIGDSQAAMLGEGCLNIGDAKLTLGTGSFLCVNIGSDLVSPNTGFYPVVGWSKSVRTDDSLSCEDVPDIKLEDVTFLLEGFNSDAGNSLVKLKEANFFNSYLELEETLKSITSSFDETLDASSYFVPSSLGLRKSLLKSRSRRRSSEKILAFVNTNSGLVDGGIFVGLPLNELKGSMDFSKSLKHAALFALMDSLVMAARLLFVKGVNKELMSEIKVLRVNGNLTRSDWIMQRLADTLNLPVERSSISETCCLGAAIAAGVGAGIWTSYSEAVQLVQAPRTRFEPDLSSVLRMEKRYLHWTDVCNKTLMACNSGLGDLGRVISLNDLVSTAQWNSVS